MKILVGGIVQESNTFSPLKSSMENFYNYAFLMGEELRTMPFRNELVGFYEVAREAEAEIIPTLCCYAAAGGVFAKEAFRELKQLLISQIEQADDYDGVFFLLHGAMTAEGCDDVDGELVAEIRRLIGEDIPLVISLDLHANVTERMVRHVNGIVGYQTYPHIDFFETGYRAGKLLFSIIREEIKPVVALHKIPMIVPAENSQTSHGPFAELWREALAGEARGESLITSLFPVQPWLDIDEMGFAVVVVGEDERRAALEAERLAKLAWDKRHAFDIELFHVTQIIDMALRERGNGEPFIISDSADSAGAGATGDSNFVLKQLLTSGVEDKLSCLLMMVDVPAVAQAIAAGVGATIELTVGYTVNHNPQHGTPIKVTGTVRKIGDGRFLFKDGFLKNLEGKMGRCVVFQIAQISLLLSEKAIYTGDPAMYRSMGLEPAEADIVLVKSANQFRADYEKISSRIYILDTPGCSTANLKTLSFQKLQRPFYPFDDNF